MPFPLHDSWEAYYYDGRTADREPVRVTLSTGTLTIHREQSPAVSWNYRDLKRGEASVDGGPVRLEKGAPSPEVLLFPDRGVLAAIRRVDPYASLGGGGGGIGAGWKLLGGLVFTSVAAIAVLYVWVLPAVGGFLATLVPPSFEERLGASVVRQFTLLGKVCEDPSVKAPLERVLAEVTARFPDSPYRFRLYVVDHETVNALAAPGGHIILYRGLIDKARTPEELAAVLAHEVTHVAERHGTRAMMRSLTFWALVSFLTGDTSGTIISLVGAFEELRFSRTQEEDADAGARRVFEEARLDPGAIVRMYQKLETASDDAPALARYLSTHPRMEDRVRTIEEWRRKQAYSPRPLTTGTRWPPLVAGCGTRARD
jgi:Zn-dependent protease with chaperone function